MVREPVWQWHEQRPHNCQGQHDSGDAYQPLDASRPGRPALQHRETLKASALPCAYIIPDGAHLVGEGSRLRQVRVRRRPPRLRWRSRGDRCGALQRQRPRIRQRRHPGRGSVPGHIRQLETTITIRSTTLKRFRHRHSEASCSHQAPKWQVSCPVPSDLRQRQAADLGCLSLSGTALGGCGCWFANGCEAFRRGAAGGCVTPRCGS